MRPVARLSGPQAAPLNSRKRGWPTPSGQHAQGEALRASCHSEHGRVTGPPNVSPSIERLQAPPMPIGPHQGVAVVDLGHQLRDGSHPRSIATFVRTSSATPDTKRYPPGLVSCAKFRSTVRHSVHPCGRGSCSRNHKILRSELLDEPPGDSGNAEATLDSFPPAHGTRPTHAARFAWCGPIDRPIEVGVRPTPTAGPSHQDRPSSTPIAGLGEPRSHVQHSSCWRLIAGR